MLSIPDVTRFNNWQDAPAKGQVERSLRWMAKISAPAKAAPGSSKIANRKRSRLIRFNSFEKNWRCGQIGYELHPDFWARADDGSRPRHRRLRHETSGSTASTPGRCRNAASDRVLEKAGFRHEGTLRQRAWFKGAFHDFRISGVSREMREFEMTDEESKNTRTGSNHEDKKSRRRDRSADVRGRATSATADEIRLAEQFSMGYLQFNVMSATS